MIKLAETLANSRRHRIHVSAMTGAVDSFVLSGLIEHDHKAHLVVCVDKEAAAYTFNTIKNILPDTYTHFLPDSFKRPLQFDTLGTNQILQRTEAINDLIKETDRPKIIVTYPEALMEKVISPKVLQDRKISAIKFGKRLRGEL